MRLLLDTHVVLWWLGDDPRLGVEIRDLVASPQNDVFVSAASAWELSIKRLTGKLEAPEDFEQQLEAHGFTPLPITVADGLAAGALPPHHRDLFDRMLVAQALDRGLTIVTRNSRLATYGSRILGA